MSVIGDELPAGLKLDPATGVIAGKPEDSVTARDYNVTFIAHNGILPDARLPLRITVAPPAKKAATPEAGGTTTAEAETTTTPETGETTTPGAAGLPAGRILAVG